MEKLILKKIGFLFAMLLIPSSVIATAIVIDQNSDQYSDQDNLNVPKIAYFSFITEDGNPIYNINLSIYIQCGSADEFLDLKYFGSIYRNHSLFLQSGMLYWGKAQLEFYNDISFQIQEGEQTIILYEIFTNVSLSVENITTGNITEYNISISVDRGTISSVYDIDTDRILNPTLLLEFSHTVTMRTNVALVHSTIIHGWAVNGNHLMIYTNSLTDVRKITVSSIENPLQRIELGHQNTESLYAVLDL